MLTMIRGKHTFKFGGMYQKGSYNGFGRQCVAGCANFSFMGTGLPGIRTSTRRAATRLLRSCWVGPPTARSIPSATSASNGRTSPAISRTTGAQPETDLNLGLRWETTLPPVEELDRWSDFRRRRRTPAPTIGPAP